MKEEYCDSDSDEIDSKNFIFPNSSEETNDISINVVPVPERSKKKYDSVHNSFMEWRAFKNINSISENVLLAYFEELSKKYKSSSLWAIYSMLKSTLNIYDNINIESYTKLRAFLKRKSVGYIAKKTNTLTTEEINKFMNDAPDNKYLATKVALIMGLMGACRINELYHMNIKNFQDLGSAVVITLPNSKTKDLRTFTIMDSYYTIYKKYANLRPENTMLSAFFLNYQNGKCSAQRIGINKFGSMGKEIAKFLKLPNPELYTGHCFRRSSSAKLQRHGEWNSTNVMEADIDNFISNKTNVTNEICESTNQSTASTEFTPSTASSSSFIQNTSNVTKSINVDSMPALNFSNCSNFTINVNIYKSEPSE